MNKDSKLSDPQNPPSILSMQSSSSKPPYPSPKQKDYPLALSKCPSSDQSTSICQSLTTLATMHQSNTMGQEPSRNQIYNPSQVVIAITEPAIPEADEVVEQQMAYPGRRKPRRICCGKCGKVGLSVTQSSIGTGSWIIFLMFLMIGCLMCAWIPLVLPDCMDVKHYCANCGTLAGVNRYLLDG